MPDSAEHPVLTHAAVARVRAGLAAHGIGRDVVYFEQAATTAALAAEKLGVDVAQIANSLVFEADGDPLLVLTSGAHRVDLEKVRLLSGHRRIGRASAAFVREHTGQAIGGVAPIGHPGPIQTLVDEWLARYDVVWAAAGHPHTVFPTTYDELLLMTGGRPADVGAA